MLRVGIHERGRDDLARARVNHAQDTHRQGQKCIDVRPDVALAFPYAIRGVHVRTRDQNGEQRKHCDDSPPQFLVGKHEYVDGGTHR